MNLPTRACVSRAVVVGMAAIAGLVVVGFTWLAETALDLFLFSTAKPGGSPCCGHPPAPPCWSG